MKTQRPPRLVPNSTSIRNALATSSEQQWAQGPGQNTLVRKAKLKGVSH